MLDAAPGGPIRVDDMTASLLDARFDVTRDEARLSLAGARRRGDRAHAARPRDAVRRPRAGARDGGGRPHDVDRGARGRAVLVLGAAGMGKSRLRAELLRRLRQREARVTVWTGAADAMGQLSAFSLLGGVLRKVLDIGQARDPGAALEAVVARRVGDADRARLTEFLSGALSRASPPPRSRARGSAPRGATRASWPIRCASRGRTSSPPSAPGTPCSSCSKTCSGPTPRASIPWTRRCAAWRTVTVLALGRPETLDVFPAMFRSRDVQEIGLGPLSKWASERLVRDVLGARCTDADVATIVDRAGATRSTSREPSGPRSRARAWRCRRACAR